MNPKDDMSVRDVASDNPSQIIKSNSDESKVQRKKSSTFSFQNLFKKPSVVVKKQENENISIASSSSISVNPSKTDSTVTILKSDVDKKLPVIQENISNPITQSAQDPSKPSDDLDNISDKSNTSSSQSIPVKQEQHEQGEWTNQVEDTKAISDTINTQKPKPQSRFHRVSNGISHAAGFIATPVTWMLSKRPNRSSIKDPAGSTSTNSRDDNTTTDGINPEPVETETQKLDREQRKKAAANPKLIESYKQEVENQLFSIFGVGGLVVSLGHMIKVLLANEFIYSHFDAWDLLQVIFSIVFQIFIISFFGHRMLGYIVGAMLRLRFRRRQRYVLGNPNLGLYDIHFGSLSVRLGFDRSEIRFHNIVWRNPPIYDRTPYFLYIHDLTFIINFPRVVKALYTRDPVPIELIIFDGVEVYMERNDSNEMLNVWYALGKRTLAEEKVAFAAFLKDAVEKMKKKMKENMAERFIQISEMIPFMKHSSEQELGSSNNGTASAPSTGPPTQTTATGPTSTDTGTATGSSPRNSNFKKNMKYGLMDFVHKIEHLFPQHRDQHDSSTLRQSDNTNNNNNTSHPANSSTTNGIANQNNNNLKSVSMDNSINENDEESSEDEDDDDYYEYVTEDTPSASFFSLPFASAFSSHTATATATAAEMETSRTSSKGRRKSKTSLHLDTVASLNGSDSGGDSRPNTARTPTIDSANPTAINTPSKKELLIDLQRAVFINFFINPIDAFTPYHVYKSKVDEARVPILLVKREQVTLKDWTKKNARLPVPPRRVCGKLGDSVVGGVVVHNRTAVARYFAAYTRHTTIKETFTWKRFRQPSPAKTSAVTEPAPVAVDTSASACTCSGAGTCVSCSTAGVDTGSARRSRGNRRKSPSNQAQQSAKIESMPATPISLEDKLAMNLHFQGN